VARSRTPKRGAKVAAARAAKSVAGRAQARMADAVSEIAATDVAFMRRALALAEQHRGRTAPNPIVGCVIVGKTGEVLAEGAHAKAGTPHAERVALDRIGGRALGGTMYVTLEPCTHHGRTPPCAPVVIASGVARVVVGSADPIAEHAGGIAALIRAGIVVARTCVAECDAANLAFFTLARLGRPAFTLKAAITLDGKIATRTGESQWITGDAARADVHRLRDTHDGVMVGVRTVLADDPQLTARVPGARDPIRIVVDSTLRTPAKAKLLAKGARVIIATTERAPAKKALRGAEIWRFPATRDGRVPLPALAKRLGGEGVMSVLAEGGGELHAALLEAELADQLVVYVAPTIVGGPAPSWVGGAGVAALARAPRFQLVGEPVRLGDDFRVIARRPW
jgi:diaminohydroxyphosphoribosylaminopyrimidine deaminase/5-amino-6-(5-phosphoribosylamino)uracil reductase